MNKYILVLHDNYGDVEDMIYTAETDKSLKQVIKIYEKGRKRYSDEDDGWSLIEYIEDEMELNGIKFSLLKIDAVLDF